MNAEEKIKNIILENTNVFILNTEEFQACMNGRTNRTELIKEKLTPVVQQIIQVARSEGI